MCYSKKQILYRVLLTSARKGLYVWIRDEETWEQTGHIEGGIHSAADSCDDKTRFRVV